MPNQQINPAELWSAGGHISHAVRAGNTIYVSGQVAWDEHQQPMAVGDIAGQAKIVFERMKRVLEEAGASFKDVVKTTTYSVDPDYRLTINAARESAGLTGQANTFIVVKALAQPELLVEVEAIAVVDQ